MSQSGDTAPYIYETNRTHGSLHPALWYISTKLSWLLIASQFIPVVATFGDKPRLSQVIKISGGIAADRSVKSPTRGHADTRTHGHAGTPSGCNALGWGGFCGINDPLLTV